MDLEAAERALRKLHKSLSDPNQKALCLEALLHLGMDVAIVRAHTPARAPAIPRARIPILKEDSDLDLSLPSPSSSLSCNLKYNTLTEASLVNVVGDPVSTRTQAREAQEDARGASVLEDNSDLEMQDAREVVSHYLKISKREWRGIPDECLMRIRGLFAGMNGSLEQKRERLKKACEIAIQDYLKRGNTEAPPFAYTFHESSTWRRLEAMDAASRRENVSKTAPHATRATYPAKTNKDRLRGHPKASKEDFDFGGQKVGEILRGLRSPIRTEAE